jgi:hypothetical protein
MAMPLLQELAVFQREHPELFDYQVCAPHLVGPPSGLGLKGVGDFEGTLSQGGDYRR